jgi:hypothetical protein
MSRALALAILICALLAPPSTAWADFQLTGLAAAPADTSAGAHSDFTLSFGVEDPAKDLRDLAIHLPPGLVGNPQAVPRCTQAEFTAILIACPAGSDVGDVTVGTNVLPASGNVYNLAPVGDEPARLGIHVNAAMLADLRLQSPINLRTSDYGLTSTLDDMPNSVLGIPIDVTSVTMTLAARVGGAVFLTNPTRCDVAAQTRVEATSYDDADPSVPVSAGFTPSACDAVPFDPGFAVTPDSQAADLPTELSATISVPGGEEPLRQSHLRRAEVILPVGTALSAGVAAGGLAACSDAVFQVDSEATPACPALSQIGTVEFDSPLLPDPLQGKVFLGEPRPGQQLRLFVLAQGSGLTIKVTGDVDPDPQSGQLTTTFDDLPELPFTSFTLSFRGGPDAVLTAPPGCGSHAAGARLTPYSGATAAQPTDGFATIDCPAPAFTPTLAAALDGSQAGGPAKLRLTVSRPDRQARLAGMRISFPPGLAGGLGSATLCPVAVAQAGGCGADSQVGTVRAVAGTGPAPLALDGTLHLTAPTGGAVAGLAVAIPARVGPLDLGVVSAISELRIRPGDAGVDVVTPSLPRIVSGIPMAIRSLELNVSRDGFLRNATSCAAAQIGATFTGQGGEQAASQAPYQATGCESLAFAPKLDLDLDVTGKGPAVHSVIEMPAGSANAKRVSVRLPYGVSPNLDAVARACPEATYNAGGCGPGSRVGQARVDTPLLPVALAGPVMLVKPPGAALPDVIVELNGPLPLKVRGSVSIGSDGRLITTFDGVPDVPLSSFVLDFAGGKSGAVLVPRGLCGRKGLRAAWNLTAHSGATRTAETPAQLKGCAARKRPRLSGFIRLRGRSARLQLRLAATGTRVRGMRVTLPKALRVRKGALARVTSVKANGRRAGRPRLRAGRRWVAVTLPKRRSARTLALSSRALRVAGKLRRGGRARIVVRVSFARGRPQAYRVRIPVR